MKGKFLLKKPVFSYIILSMVLLTSGVFYFTRQSNPQQSAQLRAPEQEGKSERGPEQDPSEWGWLQRTFPYWKADQSAFKAAMQKAQQMRAEAPATKVQQVQFAGPTNIEGRVIDIEFNPQNPNIVYAGAATGGVFKSTDMGNTWTPIFDDQANVTIGDIGIDPVNPDVIYVGTGEANGGHNNFAGGGLYKSTDGGATWQFKGLDSTVSVGRILVDPSNPQRVFLAAVGSYFAPNPQRGIYRSTDGGDTWSKSLFVSDSTGAIDIVMDPNNTDHLIAAMWERVRRPTRSHLYGPTSGIYRSLDGGDTWGYLGPTNGLPNPQATNVGRIGLAISNSNPDIVYALYSDGSNYLGLFKTSNFGTTWTNADPDQEVANGTGGFSWYFGQIRVHPTDPNTIYALDVSFMRSTDGGANWPIMYGYGGPPSLHVDNHALAFHPTNPDYLLEGNDGGINISTDGGVNWTKVAELPISQFYEIGLDHNNPQRLYGGTQDNGTVRTATGGLNDWDNIYGGDGFYVVVDHADPNIIYAESQNGYMGKSTDGGQHFHTALSGINQNEPTGWSTPVIMDPIDHNVLYYGTNHVYRTSDGANSWNSISQNLTSISGATITTIAVSPANSNIIWAGTSDSRVWVTSDLGANWSNVSSGLPYRWVTRVVPDHADQNVAYVTFSGLKWRDPQPHVFQTTNLGANWTDISGNLPDAPVNGFAVDPIYPQYLYIGTDLGAYYSANYGQSWQYLSSDLPMVPVYDLKIHDTAYYLAIGTHGRSMYKLDLAQFTEIRPNEQQAIISEFRLEPNYPNPFNPTTTIAYSVPENSLVRITIYNTLGQQVRMLVREQKAPGSYRVTWDGKDNSGKSVASGNYIYRLQAGKYSETREMTLLK